MILAAELVDTGTVVGWAGLFLAPLALVAAGWAALKTQGEARWRSAAEAEHLEREAMREGITVRDERIRSTNEWAKTIEARYKEREALVEALNERVDSQARHIATLLERTPEALWAAVEKHAAEARLTWDREADERKRLAESLAKKVREAADELAARLEKIDEALAELRDDGG